MCNLAGSDKTRRFLRASLYFIDYVLRRTLNRLNLTVGRLPDTMYFYWLVFWLYKITMDFRVEFFFLSSVYRHKIAAVLMSATYFTCPGMV